ncbi:MAG: hypothetical protein IT392_07005 [Nitrospirae bacterium]|nr:hypothetical protein [Nitrospirota bacterium]
MQILLLRVGIDLGTGGALGPIFPGRTFEYVPIPESKPSSRSVKYSNINARYGGTLDQFVPLNILIDGGYAHLDPEFETFTYGDPTKNKRGQLLRLMEGGLLVFYAGLCPPEQNKGSVLYLIGFFTIDCVYEVNDRQPWPLPVLRHLWANAHFRRDNPDDGLVVVQGKLDESRLLERAVPMSDEHQNILPELYDTLGLEGSIKRSGAGRWVPDPWVQRAAEWILRQL